MPDVLNRVAHSGESWSRELFRELALQDFLGEGGVGDFNNWKLWMTLQLSLYDPSLGQLIEGLEVGWSTDFRLVFRLWWCLVVLEASNLDMELVVELPQCLMLANSILTVESCLLSITIWLDLLLFICSFISVSIWKSWSLCYRGSWTMAAVPWGVSQINRNNRIIVFWNQESRIMMF